MTVHASSEASEEQPHKVLLKELLDRLEQKERPFYKGSSSLNWWAWHIFVLIAFLASLASSFLTGVLDDVSFIQYGKNCLLCLSVIGTAATGVLSIFQFREKEALRENGRIELEDIILNAKSRLVDNMTEDPRNDFHAIRARFIALEFMQHHRDVSLRDDVNLKNITDAKN
jgi:hypothetical protein